MGCSCHINPPCNYCIESYECLACNSIYHPDDRERFEFENEVWKLNRVIEIQREAMQYFCNENGYDEPSLIHTKAGHPIPRAIAEADAILKGARRPNISDEAFRRALPPHPKCPTCGCESIFGSVHESDCPELMAARGGFTDPGCCVVCGAFVKESDYSHACAVATPRAEND
jgi:hypothetical protein